MALLSVIISTFWLAYLVFQWPNTLPTSCLKSGIWNMESGVQTAIYISSRAINLKVIYAKHSEMSVYKTFITIGQLVLVHSPRTH